MKKLRSIIFVLFLLPVALWGQNKERLTQSIRGIVMDRASGVPIEAISVRIMNTEMGTITNQNGEFVLNNVPIGRYGIETSSNGYESLIIQEVLVSSSKQVYLEIKLRENSISLDSIVVSPSINKNQSLNSMALLGAQTFSVEVAARFAGGMDDPARLVSSYAGVATPYVSNNGISIRGNAPSLLQWRVEGIEIPNPNHFADIDVLGGGLLSALSSNVLGNSDFLIGAFPAEYNNAVSGIFDMQLRNGNNQHYQHAVQLGVLGIDLASQGPINKESNSSYIVNYRYSTTGLLEKLQGKEDFGGTLAYQDLNFKVNFPTQKAGIFSLWAVALMDEVDPVFNDQDERKYLDDGILSAAKQKSGALGISHKYLFNNQHTSLKSSIGATHLQNAISEDFYDLDLKQYPKTDLKANTSNFVFTSALNHKFNKHHTNKSGISFTNILYDMNLDYTPIFGEPLMNLNKAKGSTNLFSVYSNSIINLRDDLLLSVGMNAQHFTLNGNTTLEPRIGLKWEGGSKHSFAVGYGLHSRMEKPDVYFVRNEQMNLPNKNLDFIRSQHFMFSYVYNISQDMNLKIEPYFQSLYNVPVTESSSYSILNRRDFYITETLVNHGKGENIGVDFTFSKYLTKGMYYMLTASLFDSKYMAADGTWFNTRYNRRYITNALVGKEWIFSRDMFSVNLKMSLMGGQRYTPVDHTATLAHPDKEVQYDENQLYSKQFSPMLMGDISMSYRMNRKRVAHEFALKTINATAQKEYIKHKYNIKTNSIEAFKQKTSVFNVSYRIEF